ncbi:MAG: aminoglycoside phosphotransferase family protein [Chloroflexi bacterium]|nr:aminoglycoside phosphotransferase family protein [Chloroflexota bacterium]
MPIAPQVEYPSDRSLAGLTRLFDGAWVWEAYCGAFGRSAANPEQIRVRQFSHSPGRGALASYVLDWEEDAYLPPEDFSVKITGNMAAEVWRFPHDRQLPGLADAAAPDTALKLLNRYVHAIPARRVRVEVVRYRPGSRAVLRHSTGKVTFYVRVMRPALVSRLTAAAEVIGCSEFVVPRLAGHWDDGGVVWLSRIPGTNLRRYIRRGRPPHPSVLLDGLDSLWSVPIKADSGRPCNLKGLYRRAKRILRHATRGSAEARRSLQSAARILDPFVAAWQPTSLAHNDFYDDQMLLLPDGRIALVDFEETGPGDPMLDVGNLLAHLRIQAGLGQNSQATAAGAYRGRFRLAALDRFDWDERELDLREAVCLFRICTSTVRNIRPDWACRLTTGLSLTNQLLD